MGFGIPPFSPKENRCATTRTPELLMSKRSSTPVAHGTLQPSGRSDDAVECDRNVRMLPPACLPGRVVNTAISSLGPQHGTTDTLLAHNSPYTVVLAASHEPELGLWVRDAVVCPSWAPTSPGIAMTTARTRLPTVTTVVAGTIITTSTGLL